MKCLLLAIVAGGLVATVVATAHAAEPAGLLLYFPFDEGEGKTVKDLSVHGFEGELHGPTWTTGRFGRALAFDGTDDFVGVGPIEANPDELTIELWFRPAADITAGGPRQDLIYRRHGDGRPHVTFNRASDGRLGFYLTDKNGSERGVRTRRSSWSAGTWYHLAVVSKVGEFRIYIDGRLEAIRRIRKGAIDVQFATNGISIGARAGSLSFFRGSIDELRLWSRALTDAEVKKAANGTLLGPGTGKSGTDTVPGTPASPGSR